MCIGIPGQIRTIDGVMAKVEVCGIQDIWFNLEHVLQRLEGIARFGFVNHAHGEPDVYQHPAGDAAMCIGIPGQIRTIDGVMAKVEVCGIQREVDLTQSRYADSLPARRRGISQRQS
jgi:hydrogenase maturation factor